MQIFGGVMASALQNVVGLLESGGVFTTPDYTLHPDHVIELPTKVRIPLAQITRILITIGSSATVYAVDAREMEIGKLPDDEMLHQLLRGDAQGCPVDAIQRRPCQRSAPALR